MAKKQAQLWTYKRIKTKTFVLEPTCGELVNIPDSQSRGRDFSGVTPVKYSVLNLNHGLNQPGMVMELASFVLIAKSRHF